jgi:hypothetical protein
VERLADYYNYFETEWERCFADDPTLTNFVDSMAHNPMLCRFAVGESPSNAVRLVRDELRRGIVIYSSIFGDDGLVRLIEVDYKAFFESLLQTTLRIPVLTAHLHDSVDQVGAAVFLLVSVLGENLYPRDTVTRKAFIQRHICQSDLDSEVVLAAIRRLDSHPQQPRLIH